MFTVSSSGRVRALLLVTLAGVLGVPGLARGGDPSAAILRSYAHEAPQDCLEATPAEVGVPLPDSDSPVVLDVLVLADEVPVSSAPAELSRLAEPYEKLGLSVKMTFRPVAFKADGDHPWRDTRKATIEGRALITAAKASLKGQRPKGFDLVYVLTSKDLWSGADGAKEEDRNYSLVGIADCIGGVRFANRAFAVGEVQTSASLAGIRFSPDGSSSVAAHELGHLMGGHHHYAVCGAGAANLTRGAAELCSVMWPELSTTAFEFSPVNGAIVYGHAQRFA